jgi:hypothetical protein
MLVQTATNAFITGLMNGVYNFSTGTFNIALYTAQATLNAGTAAYSSLNEVVASGYTPGGQALTVSVTPTTGSSGNVAYLSFNNVSWSAALTARGALIYLNNGITNPSVCVLDFGSDKTSNTVFQVQFPTPGPTTSIIRIACQTSS